MVLVDTSVWIRHFREGDHALVSLLNEARVMCHQFVIGELACGKLKNRDEVLSLMQSLEPAVLAEHDEVLRYIDIHRLAGSGIGYVDAHLLASADLTGVPLWTHDRRLAAAADALRISFRGLR